MFPFLLASSVKPAYSFHLLSCPCETLGRYLAWAHSFDCSSAPTALACRCGLPLMTPVTPTASVAQLLALAGMTL